MALILSEIDLSNLTIETEFDTKMQSIVERALDGTPNIWEQTIPERSIDIISYSDAVLLPKSTISSLYALASVPNAVYVLEYNGITYNVRFRNEDLPVITAEPLLPRPDATNENYHKNIRIKLMEI